MFQERKAQTNVLIQPFISEIALSGEVLFVFFNGRYSHAFKRFSAAGQKLVQAHHGGRSFPFAASDPAVEEAQRVVKAVGALVPEPLYMRVDGVYLGNVFHVTEIEGVEPYLEMSNAFFPSEVVANAVGAIYSRFTLRRFPYES